MIRPIDTLTPEFTIIIPVYNVATYLRECLDSVLAQTHDSWEAICVDDGSTDGSGAILDEYAAADARFRVIHQANAGVSAARNAALDVAQGDWVWFVDGDDAIHPEALRFLTEVFRKQPEAAAVSIGDLTGAVRPELWPTLDCADAVSSSRRDTRSYRRFRRAGWAVVYHRSQIGALRFRPLRIGEDVLFCQEVYWTIGNWVETANPLYFYRTRDVSAMNARPTIASVADYLESCRGLIELIATHRDMWRYEDMREHLAGKSDSVYYTVRRMFFALADEDMRALLPRWLRLQWQMDRLYRMGRRRRIKLWLIALTRSAGLARLLVERGFVDGIRSISTS